MSWVMQMAKYLGATPNVVDTTVDGQIIQTPIHEL